MEERPANNDWGTLPVAGLGHYEGYSIADWPSERHQYLLSAQVGYCYKQY